MSDDLILWIIAIVCVLIHCLIKMKSLQDDAQAGNIVFNWKKDYLRRDWIPIVLSFLSCLLWYLIFDEISAKYTWLANFKRLSFGACAMVGSYAIQQILGRAKKVIRAEIDRKTNELNAVLGIPQNTKTELPFKNDASVT